jgi:hypothetical protein
LQDTPEQGLAARPVFRGIEVELMEERSRFSDPGNVRGLFAGIDPSQTLGQAIPFGDEFGRQYTLSSLGGFDHADRNHAAERFGDGQPQTVSVSL